MNEEYWTSISETERLERRARRVRRRQQRQRERRIRQVKLILPAAGALLLLAAVLALSGGREKEPVKEEEPLSAAIDLELEEPPAVETVSVGPLTASSTEHTVRLAGEEIDSRYALVMDAETGDVLAWRAAEERISPASMTKVLTLLVAVEHMADLDATFAIDRAITDYCYLNGCSVAGFEPGEAVPLRDMLYGTILPSGADAALALAVSTAGSQEAFAGWMNDKLAELGISKTAHFTNCVGLYDEDHYCTVSDMAVIMKAAMDNEVCREVLGTRTYTTASTAAHPEGLSLSNWFLRRIEDRFEETSLDITGGKTGYVKESGSCAVSCAEDPEGHMFLCVTGNAGSSWRAIYDHAALYKTYCLP